MVTTCQNSSRASGDHLRLSAIVPMARISGQGPECGHFVQATHIHLLRLGVNQSSESWGDSNGHDASYLRRCVVERIVGPLSGDDGRIMIGVMLQWTHCIERAAKAEEDSHCVGDADAQDTLRRIAASWRRLALSCQFMEGVEVPP